MKNSGWNSQIFRIGFFLATALLMNQLRAAAQADSAIKVGVYQNQPKVFIDENSEPAGIFVELLNEIARIENWKLEYVRCNWSDCLEALENGNLDLMPDVAFSIERNQKFSFNKLTVLESWSQVYVAPGSKVSRLADLEGKDVALVEGSVQQPYFRQIMQGFGYRFTEIHASSFNDAFSEVKIGIADAAVANKFFGEMHYDDYGLEKTPVIFNSAVLHFAVPKGKNEQLIDVIDRHIETWKNTPHSFYYQTLKKYNGGTTVDVGTHSHVWFYVAGAGLAVLLLLAMLLYYFRLKIQKKQTDRNNRLLFEEKEKFSSYFTNSPYGILVTNEHGKFVEANAVVCKITGYSDSEILQKTVVDFAPEDARIKAEKHFKRLVSVGKASGTLPFITKTGQRRIWTVDAVKISNTRFIGFVNDITENLRVNSRLDWLSEIFHQSVNEIYVFDAVSRHFVEVNNAALKNTGYSLDEMKRMTPLDLKLNLTEKHFLENTNKLLSGQLEHLNFQTQHFRKDGSFYEAELHVQLLQNENKKYFSAVVLDITERKKAEKELMEMKQELEIQVQEKTKELNDRVAELESFREATIARELRMEELRREIEQLKNEGT
jgi:PAS domain S-box-containing protein